jgi:hypothetical protein
MNDSTKGQVMRWVIPIICGLLVASVPVQAGLVARWAFNETGGNTAFDFVGGHHGTLFNFPADDSQWVLGPDFRALLFDGVDDFVVAEGFKGVSGTQARTVTAWIQTAVSGDIVSWGSPTVGAGWMLKLNDDPEKGVVGALQVDTGSGWLTGSTDLRDGQWHHVAATLQANAGTSNIRLYFDGQWETLSALAAVAVNTAGDQDVQQGAASVGSPNYFNGLLDNVLIYDERLSQTDIRLANGLPEPPEPGYVVVDVSVNGDGSRTVSLTFTGAPPRSVGLVADATSHAADIVAISGAPGIFNFYPDFALADPNHYDIGDGHPAADLLAPGVATLPAGLVSISVREEDLTDAVSPVEVAVIELDGDGDVCLSTDPLRGGIVDINGAPMAILNDGACFTITPPCPCRGDLSTDNLNPNQDGLVDFGDFGYFLGHFGASSPFFVIRPVPPDLLCADISDDGVLPGQNGQIDFGDLNYFMGVFGSYAPTFSGPCLP